MRNRKSRDKQLVQKIRDTLVKNAGERHVVQVRPNTCVEIPTSYNNRKYIAADFSKVCYPDRWDARYGIELATVKAFARLARKIYDEIHVESA